MKRIRVGLVLSFLFVFLFAGCGAKQEVITQDQMVVAQMNYSQNLHPIASDMADAYSQYIAFNLSEEKFKDSIAGLLDRYRDVEKNYADFNSRYFLQTPTDEMRQAITSIEAARKSISRILEGSYKGGKLISRDELLVLYMEESASMQENLETFKRIVANLYAVGQSESIEK